MAVNSAAGCATGTNTISERPTCPGGTFIEAFDQRYNAAQDLDTFVDPNLKPMEEHELQLGANREFSFGNGISVFASPASVGDNTANGNAQLGISAREDVTDLGGNHASGNGTAAQCTGVVCQP